MEYIKIGKIINTHGIKGELKISSCSDFDAERYQKGNTVYIACNGKYLPFRVQSFRTHQGYSLVSFQNAQNINDVEQYKECMIYMDAADRQPLGNGEYYRDQLLDLKAVDEEGHEIGMIKAVEETCPGQRHLRLQREGKSDALIPYIPFFIKKVDMEQKCIVIHVEEGLL
jgi:16S rRNA processing protein RimM